MAKGNIAKDQVAQRLIQAFGADYIGTFDKKYYVWGEENGEKMQVAIGLTCPKTPVVIESSVPMTSAGYNFDDDAVETVVRPQAVAPEITEQERENIAELMKRLGL